MVVNMSGAEGKEDDEGVVERDSVLGRYVRYAEQIGRGRFKAVYRGFDEKLGIDVAWAKISGTENNLTQPELEKVLKEVENGQKLKHENVVKYYLVRGKLFIYNVCPRERQGALLRAIVPHYD